jgi:hypothetical protein
MQKSTPACKSDVMYYFGRFWRVRCREAVDDVSLDVVILFDGTCS